VQVFGPDSQQDKLFKQAVVPIVNEVMDGFNCTIFAYGQTGTGAFSQGACSSSLEHITGSTPNTLAHACKPLPPQTGKTFTMEGGPRESTDGRNLSAAAGVIPRSIKQIFDTIESSNADANVKVSFLELYNEELTDLLWCGLVVSRKSTDQREKALFQPRYKSPQCVMLSI
jgi:kinesin family protein 11